MRKIWSRIRKIFASIGLAVFTFGTKTSASDFKDMTFQPDYGVPVKPEDLSFWEKALPIIKTIFLPLILIIGLIVYWKKSKSEKKKKIYITIVSIIFVALIYGIIYLIEYTQSI